MEKILKALKSFFQPKPFKLPPDLMERLERGEHVILPRGVSIRELASIKNMERFIASDLELIKENLKIWRQSGNNVPRLRAKGHFEAISDMVAKFGIKTVIPSWRDLLYPEEANKNSRREGMR